MQNVNFNSLSQTTQNCDETDLENAIFNILTNSDTKLEDIVYKIVTNSESILRDRTNRRSEKSLSPRNVERLSTTVKSSEYLSEMFALMSLSPSQWQERDNALLLNKIDRYSRECVPPREVKGSSWGYVRKLDLDPNSTVIEIGDIHGNLDRLKSTFVALRKMNYLNDSYKIIDKNTICVFLGDYLDRGFHNLGVMEWVLTFALENPGVYLLRGNHEDPNTREGKLERYAENDPRYLKAMKTEAFVTKLNDFFTQLPLSLYVACKTDTLAKRRYMLYTHAAFDPFYDPIPLLVNDKPEHVEWISINRDFSDRIHALTHDVDRSTIKGSKILDDAKRINEVLDKMKFAPSDIYWLDVGPNFVSKNDDPYGRGQLSGFQIKAFFNLWNTEIVKVSQMTRGHQADIKLTGYNKYGRTPTIQRPLVTTLDPTRALEAQVFSISSVAPDTYDWNRKFCMVPLRFSNSSIEIIEQNFPETNPEMAWGPLPKRVKSAEVTENS